MDRVPEYTKSSTIMPEPKHMGAERPNSFKEVSGGQLYGKMTNWHHWSRNYVSPNQSCPVFQSVNFRFLDRVVGGHEIRDEYFVQDRFQKENATFKRS